MRLKFWDKNYQVLINKHDETTIENNVHGILIKVWQNLTIAIVRQERLTITSLMGTANDMIRQK